MARSDDATSRDSSAKAGATEPDAPLIAPGESRPKAVLKIGLRIAIAGVAVGFAVFALFNIFEDLDFDQIRDSVALISDAEWFALALGWAAWIGAQGLQTASLVKGLPARRGVVAFLGPAAVASLIPGPSDLPVRYSMYRSWGVATDEAATAVAASGLFSVGSQLALPAIAGLMIFFGDIPLDGFLWLIVVATLLLAVSVVVIAFALGSAARTARLGQFVEPVWRLGHRILRRNLPEEPLGDLFVARRAMVVDYLRDKWLPTSGATVLTILTKSSLLVMTLRFVGIPEDVLGWSAIFVVFALVAGLTLIPITPGSAGVAELAFVGMLTPIAGSEFVNEVAAGVLLYRMLTWILIIPTGFAVLAGWRVSHRGEPAEPAPA